MNQSIDPIHYYLTIEPDLQRFLFTGQVILQAHAEIATETIVLDCAEIAVWECWIKTDLEPEETCRFALDPANERLTVHLPFSISGTFELSITFAGKINDRMAGFYRSRIYDNPTADYIAVTQFQESDARRAFPCLDHPAKKAAFELELIIDQQLTAVSNTDVQTITELDGDRQQVTFEPTPKMSTYLIFWGVGPFAIENDSVDARVRAVCLPEKIEQAHFGLTFGRKALAYGEDYYGIPYPLSKMDLIAVPDFAFGAMENWGAITFRENLLLNIPGVTSREAQARICEVIAHEIVHQWFGNLVTPREWKYLWLNESFATYFGFGMVDHYYPAWKIWHQFIKSQTETALSRDALHETFAIEMPDAENVAITTSTAPIIYNKGGSILRQMEAWIGPDNFKMGLQRFLSEFAYGCAASHHLWEALEAVSDMPVTRMMQNWVTQPGFPQITTKRSKNRLILTQKRFTCLPNQSDQTWIVPVRFSTYGPNNEKSVQTVMLDKNELSVDLPPQTTAYKLNSDQTGFYHVAYDDPNNYQELGQMVQNKTLNAIDRWGLQNDLFAQVKSGSTSMKTFLDFCTWYRQEASYLPLSSLDNHLFGAYQLLSGDIRTRTAQTAVDLMSSALGVIGYSPSSDEPQTTAILRDQLFFHGALLEAHEIMLFLKEQFEAFSQGQAISPEIYRSVLTAGAVLKGENALEKITARFEESTVEHERMALVSALGNFKEWAVQSKALAYSLNKVPDRIRFIPLVMAANNPEAQHHLWLWLTTNIDQVIQMHPLLFERVVASIVPTAGLKEPENTRLFCLGLQQKRPQLEDVVALSLERLEINRAFQANNR